MVYSVIKEILKRLKVLFYGVPKCDRCERLLGKTRYYKKQYLKLKNKL